MRRNGSGRTSRGTKGKLLYRLFYLRTQRITNLKRTAAVVTGNSCLISQPESAVAHPVVVWEFQDWAGGSTDVLLVVDDFVGCSTDSFDVNGVDASKQFRDRDPAIVRKHLSTNVLADSGTGESQRYAFSLGGT